MANHNSVQAVGVKVTTTDATATEIARFQTQEDKTYLVTARIIGKSTTNNGGYILAATFKNVDGTVTQVSTTTAVATHEDAGGWAATIAVDAVTDTTDVIVTVTGEAAVTVNWVAALDILEV